LCDADDDNDGLLDTYEISIGTQPLNVDTDGDTFNDGVEVNAGSDPLDRLSIPIFSAPILTPLASLLLCLLLILSAGYQLTLPLRCSRPIHSRKTQ
ncbi:MAG: thrombospondin type 3 repeat-containing protein, partial [Thiotrichaceae bacterium]